MRKLSKKFVLIGEHDCGYQLCIDGKPQFFEVRYLGSKKAERKPMTVSPEEMYVLEMINSSRSKFPFPIMEYDYNGFAQRVIHNPKIMDYMGRFVRWTEDPGIVEMECSDRITRYIPCSAIIGRMLLGNKNHKEKTVLFGMASKS